MVMGQDYHKNLTIADAVAICYCWLLLDVEQPSYGRTRSLFVPDRANGLVPRASSHQLRVFGAYTRHIHEGMVRVDTSVDCKDLLVTAVRGADDRRTVVLLNRGARPLEVDIDWPGAELTGVEITDPYHANTAETSTRPDEPAITVTLTNVPLIRDR